MVEIKIKNELINGININSSSKYSECIFDVTHPPNWYPIARKINVTDKIAVQM